VDNDLIPVYHHMQCQWEMGVAGFRRWVLAVYFGGDEFRLYRIERNDLMLAMMRRRAHEFWRRHLDPSGPLLRPDDAHWQPHIGVRDARKPKLTGDALLNAPIPGASHG
jgi:predicted phage-related endonuclease